MLHAVPLAPVEEDQSALVVVWFSVASTFSLAVVPREQKMSRHIASFAAGGVAAEFVFAPQCLLA
jgi:hypothetical protein